MTYQLSLLGDPPRVDRPYRPPLFVWRFCGIPLPPDADAMRQWRMMHADTAPQAPDGEARTTTNNPLRT